MPERVQMSRQHPWRADHPEAVIVDRTTKWGNPFKLAPAHAPGYVDVVRDGDFVARVPKSRAREHLVEHFRAHVENTPVLRLLDVDELAGRDLACWCPLDGPCHADVLLELANAAGAQPRADDARAE